MQRPSVDFPQPDSPTRPTVSPGMTSRRHAIDGMHDRAAVRRESAADGELLASRSIGLEQRQLALMRLPEGSMRLACAAPSERRPLRRISRSASGQRGPKAQPGGRSNGDGGAPRIDRSRRGRSPVSGGIESSRARV